MENAITRDGNGATEGREETEASGVAEFIASMCADLSQMARSSGFETLAFILDMAIQEAEQQSEDDLRRRPELKTD